VELKQVDFAYESPIISSATVTFFNNYGPWFTAHAPGKSLDYCYEYCSQITQSEPGSQIMTLSPLVEARHWIIETSFKSKRGDFTWTDQELVVFHYTIPQEKSWTCPQCTLINEILMAEECQACETRVRQGRKKSKHNNLR
jgi:predicted dithiol-disulfide oxidoreductase (DUF899 family)